MDVGVCMMNGASNLGNHLLVRLVIEANYIGSHELANSESHLI